MAKVEFKNHEVADLKIEKPIEVDADFSDIGYIPGYQKAEEERRVYYEDFKQRVENGEFNGKDGEKGDKGDKGDDGILTFTDFTDEQRESLRGPQGDKGDKGDKGDVGGQGPKGDKGEPGDAYVLTDADKQEISTLVLNLLPNGDEVSY